MIQVQIKGLKRTQNFLAELPKHLNKEIMAKSEYFMRFIQKSAKLRAPRFTGFLASGISIRKENNSIILESISPYAAKQEIGEGLPIYEKISKLSPWFNASRTMGPGKVAPGGLPPKKGYFVVRNYKPHIFPALESGLKNLPNMLKNAVDNAIKSSGGRKNA